MCSILLHFQDPSPAQFKKAPGTRCNIMLGIVVSLIISTK
jgi:hypothetical protein